MTDIYQPHTIDVLTWLQGWYASRADGDWEHSFGIEIGTLDNPGWRVAIGVSGTDLAERPFDRQEIHRSEHDWLVAWLDDSQWQLACGPLNLAEGLTRFRNWAGDIPRH